MTAAAMQSNTKRWDWASGAGVILPLLAVFYVGLACVGAWRSYSPVPFWDMWDGFLQNHLLHGVFGGLARQHNEHRIVWARLLFELDLHVFGGRSVFLFAANLIFIALTGVVAMSFLARRKQATWWLAPVLFAWLFSWGQRENITWAFQSQFILATLLPFAAFHQALKATQMPSAHGRHATFALVLAISAAGAMANGLLALPLLTIYAWVQRWNRRWISVIAISTALVWLLYFRGYASPGHHGSVVQSFLQQPVQVMHYLVLYLGSPFFYAFGESYFSKEVAAIAGATLLTLGFAKTLPLLGKRSDNRDFALDSALLMVAAFVVLSALVTAGGRVVFGVDQALSSRYVTPALLAWTTLALLYVPQIEMFDRRCGRRLWIAGPVLLLGFIPHQLRASQAEDNARHERLVSALALELGVNDIQQIQKIFHTPSVALSVSESLVRTNASVFGISSLRDMRQLLGAFLPLSVVRGSCHGRVDSVGILAEDSRFMKLKGWFYNPVGAIVSRRLLLQAENGTVIGFGVGGQERGDVATTIGTSAHLAGFVAYVRAPLGNHFFLTDVESNCRINVSSPVK